MLRRWADEPGVDRWAGTFPSEEAAQAWAAIDSLARRYVSESVCPTLERARAKALTDLVAGNATVETVVTLTVPAAAVPGAGPPGARADEADLVEVTGPGSGSPFLASRRWLASTLDPPASTTPVSASVEV
ncbi:MAG TPA: hypothetical protein VLQ78_08150, partial [Ornithinibacter sp.]|nr:hypothetical protein [Ornithinibacter sp.]